jgi:hypothetical protein
MIASRRRFGRVTLATVQRKKILGIRAGLGPAHRFIGVWAVVVEGRVFVRSWGVKPRGWWRALREHPLGTIRLAGRDIPVRAIQTRSEGLKDAVSRAYKEKYDKPGEIRYVKDMSGKKSRDTTTELAPLE